MGVKGSHPRVTLAVVSVAGLAYAVLTSAIVPAIPTIQDDLNASEAGVTFVLTGYLLSASVATATTCACASTIPGRAFRRPTGNASSTASTGVRLVTRTAPGSAWRSCAASPIGTVLN